MTPEMEDDYDYAGDAALVLSLMGGEEESTNVAGMSRRDEIGSTSEVERHRKAVLTVANPEAVRQKANIFRNKIEQTKKEEERWIEDALPKKRARSGLGAAMVPETGNGSSLGVSPSSAIAGDRICDIRISSWKVQKEQVLGTISGADLFTVGGLRKNSERLYSKKGLKFVCIGCIVNVLLPQVSEKGKSYTTVFISDLNLESRTTIPVTGFQNASTVCATLSKGSVVAILHGGLSSSWNGQGPSIVVSKKHQIMVLGDAKDFGKCSIRGCDSWTDKRIRGSKCKYHAESFFKKAVTSSRPALNAFTAPASREFDPQAQRKLSRHKREREILLGSDSSRHPIAVPEVKDLDAVLTKSKHFHYGNGARFFRETNEAEAEGKSKEPKSLPDPHEAQEDDILLEDSSEEEKAS